MVKSKGSWTLTEHLEELERTDPAVAKAARDYDNAVSRILFRYRISERRKLEGKPPLPGYPKL